MSELRELKQGVGLLPVVALGLGTARMAPGVLGDG